MKSHTYTYIVVEDESLLLKSLIKKLENLNLPLELVGSAKNGQEAITLVDKVCPDVVITDIKMPVLDGMELAQYLKLNHVNTRIILLSGHSDFEFAQTAIKYGVKDYLLKPISSEALYNSLSQILIGLDKEKDEINAHFREGFLGQAEIAELVSKYLQENYNKELNFKEMARYFGYTQEYLSKVFKKYFNDTMQKYLTRLRINEAKHLLLSDSKLDINKVGELVGYKDAFYFSKAFKANTGMGPREFRKNSSANMSI